MRYDNRADAGRRLARSLEDLRERDAVVLAIPPGGVPVAFEVARHLGAPLDLAVVRALSVPWQPELDFGAVGECGVRVLDQDVVRESGLGPAEREGAERTGRAELERRLRRWRTGRTPVPLAGRTAVVVDDEVTTGAAAEAACRVARARGADRVVLAVPVAPEAVLSRLTAVADRVVCEQPLRRPGSPDACYKDFGPTTDAEITALLAEADRAAATAGSPTAAAGAGIVTAAAGLLVPELLSTDREVEVSAGRVRLAARLTLPATVRAVVAYAHGGSRPGARQQYIAATLHRAGLGTMVVDLLSEDEERNRHNAFDIVLLAGRLHAAASQVRRETGLPVSLCGEDTCAAAALEAAVDDEVRAVVCLSGRPDLASPAALARLRAPALLVVGALDTRALGLNRCAADWMHCDHRVAVVPGATRLFTEPGTLEAAAELTRDWFTAHLARLDRASRLLTPA
ncbi:phosphoribosyltransferase [Streptomyces sp. NPDC046831]|uniref:phosphoribosyltransferase n=1 Tax=Streptomyces sp. NPDC046831 TaxID=3154805 RepID=UPI0033C63CB8